MSASNELRDALARLHAKRLRAAIPARDHELALIIGVDEPDEIAEHDAVLVAEAGARQHHRCQIPIAQMNRDPRGDKFGAPGRQLHCLIDARTQVKAG